MKFSQLFLRIKGGEARCIFCGSADVARIYSTFCVQQSEESRLKGLDAAKLREKDFYKDTRNIGLWSKKRTKELGADFGAKLEEIVEKARRGKIFDEIF